MATIGVGPLVPGQTKAYWVSCTPTVVGPFATYLTLTFVAGVFTRYTQELTVPLFWNAVGAQAELAPSTLDFGTVVVGARSATAPVTLRNRGQLPLIVSYALIGAGFQVTGQAPTSIAAGQDEEIFIEFRPAADGPASYPFTIASNSAQLPAPVLLTDYLFQGVVVPAGNHVVELTYQDPWIGRGLAVSAISWAVVLLVLTWLWVAARRAARATRRPGLPSPGGAALPR